MKMKNTVSSAIFVVILLAMGGSVIVTADTGGGSGRPITPYDRDDAPTEDQVSRAWQKAARSMRVEGVRVQGSNASRSWYKVGFAYLKPGDATPAPVFDLSGSNEQGKPETITLGSIAKITLVSVARHLSGPNDAVIEIEQFPTLAPAELLAAKPTYSVLKKQHSRTITLRVPITSSAGDLTMIGTEWWDDDKYRPLFRISELVPATPIPIRSDGATGLWWAIPSVTDDPEYPHRKVMKK